MAKAWTESEWLTSAVPKHLLGYLRDSVSPRKLRLIASACCRRVWPLLTDARSQRGVEVNEAFADGEATTRQLGAARRAAEQAFERFHARGRARPDAIAAWAVWAALRQGEREQNGHVVEQWVWPTASVRMAGCAAGPGKKSDPASLEGASKAERAAQAELIRDIVGNPFRTASIEDRWRSATVVELTRTIYQERAFNRLPILADALMDAGCSHEDLLAHCRCEGTHTLGCWVVDLILAKQ